MQQKKAAAAVADFKVKDLSLADWGRREIRIAETEMPGLMSTRAEFGQKLAQTGDDSLRDCSIAVLDTAQGHHRRGFWPSLPVEHQGGGGRTVPQKFPPVAKGIVLGRHQPVAVARQPPDRDVADDLGRPWRQSSQGKNRLSGCHTVSGAKACTACGVRPK